MANKKKEKTGNDLSIYNGSETKKAEPTKIVHSKNEQFPIVGVGASAGGLEALEQFFGNMPSGSAEWLSWLFSTSTPTTRV